MSRGEIFVFAASLFIVRLESLHSLLLRNTHWNVGNRQKPCFHISFLSRYPAFKWPLKNRGPCSCCQVEGRIVSLRRMLSPPKICFLKASYPLFNPSQCFAYLTINTSKFAVVYHLFPYNIKCEPNYTIQFS